ncbi:hypothetical protein XENTR_v10019137 [Xenopus tropicalis]|nr:hypothetical protein XENTR_v10019137 [Xenopus tropicalis]
MCVRVIFCAVWAALLRSVGFTTWEWFLIYKIRSGSALEGVNVTVLQNAVSSAVSVLSRQTVLQVKYWKMRSS